MKLPSFGKRAAHTLLFITEVKTFRVDADRKGVLLTDLETIERGCEEPARLAKTLQKISDQTVPFGRKLWLLFLRLPTHLVNVPSLQVQGVDENTLTQALQFELEGITGQSSQDSRIAFRFVRSDDDMSDYWLTQIDQLALDDLLKAAKQCKTKLAGLLHPGGLPLALAKPEAPEWLRLEAWPNQLHVLRQTEDHSNLQVFSFDNPHWRSELEQWLDDAGTDTPRETLLNNKLEVLPDSDAQFRLNEEHDLNAWLGLWAQTLIATKHPPIPLITPPSRYNPDIAWMAGTGGGALLLCLLHAGWFIQQSRHYQAEADALSQTDRSMQALRKQINQSRDQKAALEKKLGKLTGDADLIPNTLATLQHRPARLLRELANGRDQELVVETIEQRNNDIVVTGVTLKPHLANQLASHLQANLADLNWQVQAPTKVAMDLFEDHGPWSFELRLIDEGIPGFGEDEKS
ncbi:hypothetical protein [Methylomarinum vadi]|uniref:hypothetical protein n=1 Tax=Methylomarinum vadi TaxID=438855 RepID=UPI0004DEF639|nr:hypothetical protein [Methylomarinum vadi]